MAYHATAPDESSAKTFNHVFTKSSHASIDQFWIIDKSKVGTLGEGSYGTCKIAYPVSEADKKKEDRVLRCVKEIVKKKIKDQSRFDLELFIQQSLDHPNIVKVYETYMDYKNYYLVMELCTGGELFDRIVDAAESSQANMAFDEHQASTYMQQIFGAMQYLHSKQFAHRDIKPENFLMSSKKQDAHIKVIDFGLAKNFEAGKPMTTKAGTPYYVAPQVLLGSYDEKCDVWSCGVIAYILLSGVPPFYGDTDPEILKAVKKGDFDFPSPDWDGVSASAKDLIKEMLIMDPKMRPGFIDLISHRWLTEKAEKGTGKLHNGLGDSLKKFCKAGKFKKLALTCIAKQLNDKDIENLRTTFETLDKNKDGTLTIAEIKEGMKNGGVEVPDSLRHLDTDGSGVVDYTEFLAATIEASVHISEAKLWAAFRILDSDGDGQITKDELRKAVQCGAAAEEEAALLQQMMNEVDTDHDEKISFEEFAAAVRK